MHWFLLCHNAAKIVEIKGISDKGWKFDVEEVIEKAAKNLHGIRWIEVSDMTAIVDPTSGKLTTIEHASNYHSPETNFVSLWQ